MPQRIRRASGLLVGLGLLGAGPAGCGGSQAAGPEWVRSGRAPAAYPAERFVIGVGSGRDEKSAGASARGEIARTFRAHVEQEIADRQRSTSSSTSSSAAGSSARESGYQDIEARTRIKTSVMLQGVRIAERWQDPATRLHWALAVLDREQQRRRMQADFERESERLGRELAAIDLAVGPAAQLDATRRALDAARALEEPRSGLLLLGNRPAATGPALPGVAALEQRMAALRERLPVEIEARRVDLASGEDLGALEPLRAALAEAVTGLGFPIREAGPGAPEPWLRVRSQLGIAPQPELSQEYFVYRWEGRYELSRPGAGGGEVLAVVSEHGRITHSRDEPARRLARREGQEALAASLRSWLVEPRTEAD